jgi:hypothetical protein
MKAISTLVTIIVHPRKTSREVLKKANIYPSLSVVLGSGAVLAILFVISYFKKDYPASPEIMQIWIRAWGEFGVLPFLKIPPESYRLFLAIAMIPIMFAIWILMAGSARFLSILFNGKVTFKQYLCLFGFSFFTFLILQTIVDIIFSGFMKDFELLALKMEYGPLVAKIVTWFPMIVYPAILAIGGIYNGIVTQEGEKYPFWKTVLVSVLTAFWPIIFIAVLIR